MVSLNTNKQKYTFHIFEFALPIFVFHVQTTLKVLFNFNEDEDDLNNFSGYTFVSTTLLLVINMFANDLKMPVEYLNKMSQSRNVDIFVNFHEDDGVYNASSVEMFWPHYQNRYCLIYANTRMLPPSVLSFTSTYIILGTINFNIAWIFLFITFRYR